mmetsp:Transcript_34628/g.112695  ORF Transcript_34628/g.112695 Transcript_34628/m.112695 type:complete len:305 (+) Transcript_34628:456-1370(+)
MRLRLLERLQLQELPLHAQRQRLRLHAHLEGLQLAQVVESPELCRHRAVQPALADQAPENRPHGHHEANLLLGRDRDGIDLDVLHAVGGQHRSRVQTGVRRVPARLHRPIRVLGLAVTSAEILHTLVDKIENPVNGDEHLELGVVLTPSVDAALDEILELRLVALLEALEDHGDDQIQDDKADDDGVQDEVDIGQWTAAPVRLPLGATHEVEVGLVDVADVRVPCKLVHVQVVFASDVHVALVVELTVCQAVHHLVPTFAGHCPNEQAHGLGESAEVRGVAVASGQRVRNLGEQVDAEDREQEH